MLIEHLFYFLECYEEVEKQFGKVSVVVNNAAYFSDSNFKKLIEINMVGASS